ncbi:MAG: YbaB/EbfC family nucleoid-associated protein [Anaerolineaceae bacterium]
MAKGYNAGPSPRAGGNMMSQIAKLQEQMAAAQEELTQARVTETAGGGAVSVTMSGDQRCLEVKVQEDVLTGGDVEMLQDLLLTAINKSLDSSRELSEQKMAPFTNMLSGMGMGR